MLKLPCSISFAFSLPLKVFSRGHRSAINTIIERFSNESRKTKVITLTNQNSK